MENSNKVASTTTRLKKERLMKGLTSSDLADKAGVALARVQHYESGYRDINKAEAMVVYKLAEAIGCDVKDILELPEVNLKEIPKRDNEQC